MSNEREAIRYEVCPVCDSQIHRWREKRGAGDRYNMDVCSGCGYCFVNPRPSLDFLMEYYSTHGHGDAGAAADPPTLQTVLERERTFPNSTLDAKRIVKTITQLKKSSSSNRFLDVGCGYGFFSAEALRAGFDVQAIELATNERKIAQELTGLIPVASSFEDFRGESEAFGAVLMSQILEHALDVNLWIEKSRECLAPNGILAIALPNYGSLFRRVLQEKDPFVCPPTHLNFFSPRSLSALLRKHGFTVEKVEWVSRLPKSSFEKRCPGFAKPVLPLVHFATGLSLGLVDRMRLGMIICVYGRKKG